MTPIEPSDTPEGDWRSLVLIAGACGAMLCHEHKDLIAKGVTTNIESVAKWLFRISLVLLALPIVAHLWGGWVDKTTGYMPFTIWACVRLAQGLYLSGVAFGTKHREHHSNPPEQADIPSIKNRVELVAWAPKGMSVPLELIAVQLPPGPVTERQWWKALTDRVQELANKAGEKETDQACKALSVPPPKYLHQAGQCLVLHNLNLRTHMNLAILDESPWPATVTENDPEIQEILANQTLLDWVEHARALVSTSYLD